MPSLPRISRRVRSRTSVEGGGLRGPPRRSVPELSASGLIWVNVVAPDVETAPGSRTGSAGTRWMSRTSSPGASGPKVDAYEDEGYLFVVLHFPVYDKSVQRLNAAELDFFLGPDYLVTVPNRELLPVTRLFRRCEEDEVRASSSSRRGSGRLLYEVLDDLFDYCFPILDKIGFKLDRDRGRHVRAPFQEIVRDISNVKQEIIWYRKVIKPERPALRVLERRMEKFLPEELDLYFDDIVDAAERFGTLDNYKEVVEGLESTNESVISHRQNDVFRLLTLISVTDVAADADHERLRDERRSFPARATPAAVLGDPRLRSRSCCGDGRLLPLEAVGLSCRRRGSRTPAQVWHRRATAGSS